MTLSPRLDTVPSRRPVRAAPFLPPKSPAPAPPPPTHTHTAVVPDSLVFAYLFLDLFVLVCDVLCHGHADTTFYCVFRSVEGAVWEPVFTPLVRTTVSGASPAVDSVGLVLPTSLCSGQIADMIAARLNERLARERALLSTGTAACFWRLITVTVLVSGFPSPDLPRTHRTCFMLPQACMGAVPTLVFVPDDDSSPFRVLLSKSVTRFVALVHTEVSLCRMGDCWSDVGCTSSFGHCL